MKIRFLAIVFAILATSHAYSADISGAGATFPYPVYAKWAAAYSAQTGNRINYQSIGSGGGIKQIQQKTVTFGASDMPLSADQLSKDGLIQFPTVMGGDVPVVNIDGIKSGDLVLDGPTLASIFLGKITSWDDAAIRRLNPGVQLPKLSILVIHRSDGSGTTFIWTDYLSKVSPEWKSKVGANTSVEWPIGIGAKGNEGVANNVAQTKGAIGYVEYAYVKQAHLTFTRMVNKAGKVVAPEAPAFQAAAANADWLGTPGFSVILTEQSGERSWPITGATFILMHKLASNAEASGIALKFFDWAYTNGSQMASELDYVPMPGTVVNAIRRVWRDEIKDAGGKSVFGP